MAGKPVKKAVEKKVRKPRPAVEFAPLKFQDYTITQKRSGRFQVVTAKGKNVNGDEKAKLLVAAKVLKGSFKKAATEAAAAT